MFAFCVVSASLTKTKYVHTLLIVGRVAKSEGVGGFWMESESNS